MKIIKTLRKNINIALDTYRNVPAIMMAPVYRHTQDACSTQFLFKLLFYVLDILYFIYISLDMQN